jgi:hypothetical protein
MEWFPGLSNKIMFSHSLYQPLGELKIGYYADDSHTTVQNDINTSEISFNTRFAYREKFVTGKIDRISLGTKYPVLQLNYTYGLKNALNSDFEYHKIDFKIDDRLTLNPFGYTYWVIAGGKTWGTIPYPLLTMHPGNETYFYDYAAFNMMNYFEFVSDYYVSGYATHHFDGFFFDKIPLLRKLKWREVAQVKAVWGHLSDKNYNLIYQDSTKGPSFYTLNKKPYVEVGAGVENILKVLRFDFVWRLAYMENPHISNYGIRASFQLTF